MKIGYMLDFLNTQLFNHDLWTKVCEISTKLLLLVYRDYCKNDLLNYLVNLLATLQQQSKLYYVEA